MATFPSTSPDFVPRVGTDDEPMFDQVVDAAVNGSARARSFYTTEKKRFRPQFLLTASALATFNAFVAANRTLSFQYLHYPDNTTYTCIFEPPIYRRTWRRARALVTVYMRQV